MLLYVHLPIFSWIFGDYSRESCWKTEMVQNTSLQPLLPVVHPEATQQLPFDKSSRLEMRCWDQGKSCLTVFSATGRISEDNHAGWCRAVTQPARAPVHLILPPWRYLELPKQRCSSSKPHTHWWTHDVQTETCQWCSECISQNYMPPTCHQQGTESLWDRCPGVLSDHLPCSLPGVCNGCC